MTASGISKVVINRLNSQRTNKESSLLHHILEIIQELSNTIRIKSLLAVKVYKLLSLVNWR